MAQTPLDKQQRQLAKWLSWLPPLYVLPPKLARLSYNALEPLAGFNKQPMHRITQHVVPSASNKQNVTIRAYYPSDAVIHNTLVYFHGGGCVIGSLKSHDRFCRYLAKASGLCVIAADYSLGPEHPYPNSIIDAIEVFNFVNSQHALLGINPNNIGVAGDSAGGYLAIILSMKKSQQSLPVSVQKTAKYQVLLYPMLDLTAKRDSYNLRETNPGLPQILTPKLMFYFRKHYLQNEDLASEALASPVLSDDIDTELPTLLITCEYDPLKDEGLELAQKIKDKHPANTIIHAEDSMHGFIHAAGVSIRANELCETIAEQCKMLASLD